MRRSRRLRDRSAGDARAMIGIEHATERDNAHAEPDGRSGPIASPTGRSRSRPRSGLLLVPRRRRPGRPRRSGARRHRVDLAEGERRMHRQRQHLARGLLGTRTRTAPAGEHRLVGERDRVVEPGLDARTRQAERTSSRASSGPGPRAGGGRHRRPTAPVGPRAAPGTGRRARRGSRSTPGGGRASRSERGLQPVESAVPPGVGVVVASGLAVVAHAPDLAEQDFVVGHDHPAVAEHTQVLARIEREGTPASPATATGSPRQAPRCACAASSITTSPLRRQARIRSNGTV